MSRFRTNMIAGVAAIALIPSAVLSQAPAAPAAAGAAAAAPGGGGRGAGGGGRAPAAPEDTSPKPPVPHLRPADEQKLFQLQPGYSIAPVLTDPQIEQPGQIAFDANGRMYVLELRTYMLDADATDELTPRSRISRWEDKNNDGVYETSTVFVDNLVFPRFVLPMQDGVIMAKESNSDDTFLYADTNGDGKYDKKTLFVTGLGRSGNVEHQEGAMTWAMDNWLYSTYNSVRVRWNPNGPVLKEQVGVNGAQWGMSQDNYGKLYFTAGASGRPINFQFPVQYGNFNYADALQEGFTTPWGAPIGTADMQGGMGSVRPDAGSLNSVTAGAGGNVYRGDRLPADLVGEYLYGEVVGRVLRRSHPVNIEGFTQLQNPYQAQQSEFVRSMDPLFRPVDNKTAPDGTIYITDMYHGIIQEGEWAGPGSYLRRKIVQYQLDKAIGMGRIWRLSYNGMPRDTTQPRMYQETPAQLVAHLTHPNGWWRDMAQQQLVLRQNKTVVPALMTMARTNKNQLARIHALWTLEGLNSLNATLVRDLMKDTDPQIRAQAIHASEAVYKGGDKTLAADYTRLASDSDLNVQIQALLTMGYLKTPDAATVAKAVMATRTARGFQMVADRAANPVVIDTYGSDGDMTPMRSLTEIDRMAMGKRVFEESCGECHSMDGLGAPDGNGGKLAPQLAGDLRVQASPEHVVRVLLKGLTGPIDGKTYSAGVMVPQAGQSNEWIAALASYVRNGITNNANMVTPELVAEIRAKETRTGFYTDADLKRAVPQPLPPQSTWKVTASHTGKVGAAAGTSVPSGAFGLEGWTTGVPQAPGMWFQIELPQAVRLAGIDYQALIINAPRGGGAGAAPGGAPGAAAAAGAAAGGARGGAIAGAAATAPPAPAAPAGVRAAIIAPAVAGSARGPAYPLGYKVEVSTDGATWKTVEEGAGTSQYNSYVFDPTPAKFVKITQTAGPTQWLPWTMRYLELFGWPS